MKLSGALCGSLAWRPFCPPFLVGKTPASMTFPELHKADLELFLIKGAAVKKPPVQFSSVQLLSRVPLCDPMNHSTPGLPVHHQLPEFTQTHVHWVSDAIQPSHPPSSPSPPALNLCQHQGLCKWVSSSHEVAKGLEFQLQHQSFQWTPRTDTYWYLLEELLRTKVYT